MAKVRMTLDGFEATRRVLVKAPDVVRSHASSAVAASTYAVAQRARSLAPMDTGTLKRAIESSNVVTGLIGRVGVSAAAPYWNYVEFGTRKMAARPFFRPAAEMERDAFIQRMRDIGPKVERDLSTGRFL